MHKAFEKQLHVMKTNYADYYWLHLPNDIEENLAEIVDLYHEGRIRNIGISNFNLEEAKQAGKFLEAQGVSLYGVQNHFSLLERSEEKNGMLAWCHENGIAYRDIEFTQKDLQYLKLFRRLRTNGYEYLVLADRLLQEYRK